MPLLKPEWHAEKADDLDCALCGITSLEEDYCYGCEVVICEEHLGDPMGPHMPEEHDDGDPFEYLN